MTKHFKSKNSRLELTALLVTTSFALSHADTALAQDDSAFTSLPDSFVGLTHGTLQPTNTFRSYIGSTQTTRGSSDGQTGRQVYYGGFRYRGTGDWDLGASLTVFDDSPAAPISGSLDTLTYVGLGVDLKYQFYNDERLSAAVRGGVEAVYYSRGGGLNSQSSVPDSDKDNYLAATISVPVTYQISDPLWITGEIGYTHAASTIAGQRGFGGRAFASAGLTYQGSKRLFYYGNVKALARQIDDGIDAQDQDGPDYIYTLGAQYALTPQTAVNLYVTNAFSPTSTGSDLLFFPDKSEPVFGLMLSYIPSGRGVGENAATFQNPRSSGGNGSRFADGFTIKGPHTLAADTVHTRLSYGSAGQSELAVYYAPDPDFQLEFSIEDFALESGSDFRPEADEDIRFMIGARWQAMDEAYGQPFNLGFGLAASRDLEKPSIGSVFFEASASKAFARSEVVLNARSAIYSSETLAGAGALFSYDFSSTTAGIAEYSALLDDKPVWAVGLRHSPQNLPFSVDLYSTNAAGLNGIGSLLSNDDPQFGISLHWEGGLDLL